MGHSENINRDVYQSPLAPGEIIHIGGFLQTVDGASNGQTISPVCVSLNAQQGNPGTFTPSEAEAVGTGII